MDLKDGLDYEEVPPEVQDLNITTPPPEIADWMLVLRYLAIAILVGVILFFIIRIITRPRQELSKAKEEPEATEDDLPNALTPLEKLYEALENAKAVKDFREAIRLLHQIVIKRLNDLGKLTAAPEKTNREYLRELKWNEVADDFTKLTLLHEISWYGEVETNQTQFDLIEKAFLSFINRTNEK